MGVSEGQFFSFFNNLLIVLFYRDMLMQYKLYMPRHIFYELLHRLYNDLLHAFHIPQHIFRKFPRSNS